jgi:FtsP/CotA-like multicopper oxidase with cupredoxin domain
MINRRNFIKGLMAGAALPSVITATGYASAAKKENFLQIPPLLEKNKSGGTSQFHINVQEGATEFFKNVPVNTLGYNGSLLGKTLRVRKGEKVSISVTNSLKEHTTTHWHGLLVPGNMDGGPHQVIRPGETWKADFTIEQPATTAWYHPHGDGNTASQVYKGLGGLFLIDDENSLKLDIPNDYGVDDIPLVIQDRLFSDDGNLHYLSSMRDVMYGMYGNKVIVNGVLEPTFEAPNGKVRFRLLNGSNARTYNFQFSDKQQFDVIASDGGFLPRPVKRNMIRVSPGERYEIIADFSGYKAGAEIYLGDSGYNFMRIVVSSVKGFKGAVPEKLTEYEHTELSRVVGKRRFYLNGMGHMVNINGKKMNMRRIDEYMKLGTTEIWEVSSRMGMMMGGGSGVIHNFHAHGTLFKILSRNGKAPAPEESGWKDTVALPDGEVVQLLASFNHKGLFMYHCHILEHEDNGMMGQYIVK